MYHRACIRVLAVVLATTLASATVLACRPKTGPDRFLGTFRWRGLFGYQAITFEKNGKGTYSIVGPGERDDDPPLMEVFPGAYRVVEDTAFMAVEFPDPEERDDTLALMLRGDTLIMLNQVFGRNPVFMRED